MEIDDLFLMIGSSGAPTGMAPMAPDDFQKRKNGSESGLEPVSMEEEKQSLDSPQKLSFVGGPPAQMPEEDPTSERMDFICTLERMRTPGAGAPIHHGSESSGTCELSLRRNHIGLVDP